MDDDMKLGRVAYDAYGAATDWKTYDGRQMPAWTDLPQRIKYAWACAAAAAAAPRGHA